METSDRCPTQSDWECLSRFGRGLATVVRPAILASANPARALVGLLRLLEASPDPAPTVAVLRSEPRFAEALAALFAGSGYLTEVLLRHPGEALGLAVPGTALRRLDAAGYLGLAEQEIEARPDPEAALNALRVLRAREQLNIGCADLLGLWDLTTVIEALSSLAEGLIEAVYRVTTRGAAARQDLAVLALGKLGGRELNYSSDVDLVFVSDGKCAANDSLACDIVAGLGRSTEHGYLYRVDLRLRPWGRSGPLVADAAGYLDYLRRSANLSERQALLKARPVAGNRALGQAFLAAAEPILYAVPPQDARTAAARSKRAIERNLAERGAAWGEVKQGAGSIRDVEFVAQYLQLREGGRLPQVRGPNTLQALAALHAGGILPDADYHILADGYSFLRALEHALQLLYYAHTHRLPAAEADRDDLARRLGFGGDHPGHDLAERYEEHVAAVRGVYARYLLTPAETDEPTPGDDANPTREHVARMAPTYAEVFNAADIARHVALAAELSNTCLARVDARSLGHRRWRVEVVARDYPGELSLICGLMLAYGLEIEEGHVFTSEGSTGARPATPTIVDAFTVRAGADLTVVDWEHYEADLGELLAYVAGGNANQAHGVLARRTARALSGTVPLPSGPLNLTIENPVGEPHTVLTVDAPDARGFLYELSAALALGDYRIVDVVVRTERGHAQDVLHITDVAGQAVPTGERQDRLRATVIVAQHMTHLLPYSPDPERALRNFRGFLVRLFADPGWPRRLVEVDRPEVLTALARLLGVSDYLWEDLLRVQYDALLPVVGDVAALAVRKDRATLERELAQALAKASAREEQGVRLNAWRDREMFRIDMRHIQGHSADFSAFSEELSDLAEVVLAEGLRLAVDAASDWYGAPRDPSGRPLPVVLCGLGKLGGRELGYASDIEVLFVHDTANHAGGFPAVLPSGFWERVVQEFLNLVQAKRSGVFTVDLRLRPYGSAGALSPSLDSLRRYYAKDGPAWPFERQAMVKLRPIAGDPQLAARVLVWRDEAIFRGVPPDVVALRAMRERQLRHLVRGGTVNAKFSAGGLVDVEYLVQTLQMRHGARVPAARHPNTLAALGALTEGGVLSAEEGAALREAYVFLRRLIDGLRMVRGNAQDLTVPPEGAEEWVYLARRMALDPPAGAVAAGEDVRRDLAAHMATVAALSRALLNRDGSERPEG